MWKAVTATQHPRTQAPAEDVVERGVATAPWKNKRISWSQSIQKIPHVLTTPKSQLHISHRDPLRPTLLLFFLFSHPKLPDTANHHTYPLQFPVVLLSPNFHSPANFCPQPKVPPPPPIIPLWISWLTSSLWLRMSSRPPLPIPRIH